MKQNLIFKIPLYDYLFDFSSSLAVAMLFISLVFQSTEATVEHPVSELVWCIQQNQVFISSSPFTEFFFLGWRWLVKSAGLNAEVS